VSTRLHLGGPDHASGTLRDLLRERVRATPAGGSIDWVMYYLGDRRLAAELIRARARGAEVRLCLEAQPRIPEANRAIIEQLSGPGGLGDGLRAIAHPKVPGFAWRAALHEKLYCFSAPAPTALIGSYNPMVDDDAARRPELLAQAGDMERGHNALIELGDTELVAGLRAHARSLHTGCHGYGERFATTPFRALRHRDHEVHFWPRRSLAAHPLFRALRAGGSGTRVRIAASHVSGVSGPRALAKLARDGLQLEVFTDASRRRTPDVVIQKLAHAGVPVTRVGSTEAPPMHHKFMLVEPARGARFTSFGSYNWTDRSQWLSHEIAVISRDRALFEAFAAVWARLADSVVRDPST